MLNKSKKVTLWNVATKVKKRMNSLKKTKHRAKKQNKNDHEYWANINKQYNPKPSKRNKYLSD